jgi:hypothetical protein
MPRFYFDFRDANGLVVDDEGREMEHLDAVQIEAARSLVDMTRDSLLAASAHSIEQMSISVRDDGGSVLNVRLAFKIEKPANK